jgi:cell wall-associated NlpC family hydrolase
VQTPRRIPRRRSRVALALGTALVAVATGVLAPTAASADPAEVARAAAAMQEAAQRLTLLDEQLHQAHLVVEEKRAAADEAAAQAAAAQAALDVYAPRLRAIAKSGYTGKTQTRVSAFLLSASPEELVQQMATLDVIADHTSAVIAEVAAAQDVAERAQIAADELADTSKAAFGQLEAQKAEVEKEVEKYQADFERLSAAEQARVTTAVAGRSMSPPSVSDLPLADGSAAAIAIEVALSKVGSRYAMGGSGPDVFDCSGLTSYAYAAAGVMLPHSSRAQSTLGQRVERSALQPGDLVFYYTPISHVALYIGNGMIVHARTYGVPLSVTSVDQSGYRWAVRLTG